MKPIGQSGRRLTSLAAGVALAAGLALGLSACEAPLVEVDAYEDEAPVAEPAEEVAVDAAAEVAPETADVDPDAPAAPPPANPEGADSVQPESETLFY